MNHNSNMQRYIFSVGDTHVIMLYWRIYKYVIFCFSLFFVFHSNLLKRARERVCEAAEGIVVVARPAVVSAAVDGCELRPAHEHLIS